MKSRGNIKLFLEKERVTKIVGVTSQNENKSTVGCPTIVGPTESTRVCNTNWF